MNRKTGDSQSHELEQLAAVLRALSVLHPSVDFSLLAGSGRAQPLLSTRRATSIRNRFLDLFAGKMLSKYNVQDSILDSNASIFHSPKSGLLTATQSTTAVLYEVETAIDSVATIAGTNQNGKGGCTLRAYLCPPSQRPMRTKNAQV
jgi:hypothetical protein